MDEKNFDGQGSQYETVLDDMGRPVGSDAKHSVLGIFSFGISLLSGFLILLLFVVAGIIESASPGGMGEESLAAILIGLSFIGLIFLDLVALGLGIGGLFQKDTKKIFGILGVIFSGVSVFLSILLIVVGMMMK